MKETRLTTTVVVAILQDHLVITQINIVVHIARATGVILTKTIPLMVVDMAVIIILIIIIIITAATTIVNMAIILVKDVEIQLHHHHNLREE